MKREIKFKVWDTKANQWIWNLGMKTNNVLTNGKEQGQFNILQFTGLKDKNGVEIYEGDIVKRKKINYEYDEIDNPNKPKWKDEISFIIYRGSGFWVNDENFGWEGESLWDWDKIKVIGNIHDSPELLGS